MTVSRNVYRRLFEAYGPQHWWPGETPFEVMVGAVLVQNTNWKNVERAIDNLQNAQALEPAGLLALTEEELQAAIRPAGYFRIKSRRVRSLVEFYVEHYGGNIERLRAADAADLRRQLLAVHGIGPETADSILLYAAEKPQLVVDAYTLRVYARHGWVPYRTTYHALQEHIGRELPADSQLYNEYHALLVQVGKLHCGKQPRCEGCPLQKMLPAAGLVADASGC